MESNTEPTPIAGTQPPAQAARTQALEPPAAATPAASPAASPPVVPARPARRDPLPIVLALAALVAVGGVSFAGGRLTAPAAAVTGLPGTGQRGGQGDGQQGNGQGNGFGNGQGNGFGNLGRAGAGVAIKGTIAAVAADHITLRLDSGQTLDIPIDTGTTYHRQTSATSADVTTGAPVLVQMGSNVAGGAGPVAPNASNAPGAIGRFIGTARDITLLAQ